MFIEPPGRISTDQFLSSGAIGTVYKINECIALKYLKSPEDKSDEANAFRHENGIYDLLEAKGRKPSPYIVQSFYRLPDANFMQLMSGGSLQQRLRANQVRGKDDRFRSVSTLLPVDYVERCAMELSSAIAWLEGMMLVHGDLRPENLLLDGQGHIKLADFDCTQRIGTESPGAPPPWARVLGKEAGELQGTFGVSGPLTEQFAIGSIIYTIARGHEPYEDESDCDGDMLVHRLQIMEFPELSDSSLDMIIGRCWKGLYSSIRDLTVETASLRGAINLPRATALDDGVIAKRRAECKQMVESGLLGSMPEK